MNDAELSRSLDVIKGELKALGFLLYGDGVNSDLVVVHESPQCALLRQEIKDLGWSVFVDQKAYNIEAFAWRPYYNSRQVTPRFVKDSLKIACPDFPGGPVKDPHEEVLKVVLDCIKEAITSKDPAWLLYPVTREAGQKVLYYPNITTHDAEILELLPESRARLKLTDRAGNETIVDAPLYQTVTKEELKAGTKTVNVSSHEDNRVLDWLETVMPDIYAPDREGHLKTWLICIPDPKDPARASKFEGASLRDAVNKAQNKP